VTLIELHDARLDVIGHARDVLGRAAEECRWWRGPYGHARDVLAAMAALKDALRDADAAMGEKEEDKTVSACGWETLHLLATIEDRMGPEAAEYVDSGEGDR
jgi:hypothetical protein